uniref:Carn_acyltransf domain-containing protein n=1 Tax=Loa loa TaxID=7209 RepID=A0A1I7V8C9_LOALO
MDYSFISFCRAIPVTSEYVNYELNRRHAMLHYRDGKITPSCLEKALKLYTQMNISNYKQLESFAKLHWAPYEYILFAKPNHAEVLRSLAELKGSSANGLLFPFHLFSIRSWSFKFTDS